jgi:hypothetical protein
MQETLVNQFIPLVASLSLPAYFTALILSRFQSGIVRSIFLLIVYVVLCSILGFIFETFYFYIAKSDYLTSTSSAMNMFLGFLFGFPVAIFLLMFLDGRKAQV